MIRALGRRPHAALLVPLFLAPALSAAKGLPPTAEERVHAAARELVSAKSKGAARARIDALYEELATASAAAGSTPAQALAQCGLVPSAPPASTPRAIAAPPCSGATTTTVTFSSTDVLNIPDATSTTQNGWGTLENFIFASGLDPYLWDVDVRTNITHARCNDLKIYLLGPTGQQIPLSTDNNIFGYANLFNGTTWDDSAPTPVTDWPFVNNQVVGPCTPEGALGAYIGIDPNGVWDLLIRDDTPGNTGALHGWSVDITTVSGPPNLGGGGYFQTVNQPIPDFPSLGLVSNIVVSGADTFLIDVDVTTGILHPFPADIAVYLTSPAGTTVTLTSFNGGNRDNVFAGTVWDDSAPFFATDFAYAPNVVAPLLCPDGALSAFVGEDPNGVWTLRVRDFLAGEVGVLQAWALGTLTCAAPSPGSPFCTGDGLDGQITSACPCGNTGSAGNGCANSANPNGANLAATGTTNPDTAVLHTTGMPATATAIYLKGDVLDDVVFGDGVRCTGGNLIRMRTRISVGGASQFPDVGDPLLSVRGATPVGSGLTAYYQTYYRNAAAGFCPPATFNVSNGMRIVW